MRRNWIKLYVDQVLRGSMFEELDPDERFVWFGFLCLAGDSAHDGIIGITVTFGYSDDQISDILKVPVELIKRSKRKFVKHDKISIGDNNLITITKWKKYQSEYGRQRPYREKSYRVKLQDKVTGTSLSPSLYSSIDPSSLRSVDLEWVGITESDIGEWSKAYPACDINTELSAMIVWVKKKPEKSLKKDWYRFITGWLARSQDKGGTRNAGEFARSDRRADSSDGRPAKSADEKARLADIQRRIAEYAKSVAGDKDAEAKISKYAAKLMRGED